MSLEKKGKAKNATSIIQTNGDIMRGGLSFFVFFGDFSVVFDFAGNFFLNLTDSGQPKVVRRKLRRELFKRRTWHHVR